MNKLIILKGLPGSGKSTWAKEYCKTDKNGISFVRVNRDDLRNMRGDYWIPNQENLITYWEDMCVTLSLQQGYGVVLDSTNLNDERTKKKIEKYKECVPDLTYEIKFFDVPVEQCIKNDLKRFNSVGKDVILEMYEKHLKIKPEQYVLPIGKPKAIIVDIDGTLAHNLSGRDIYDYLKVNKDTLDTVVAGIVNVYNDLKYKIIICSGREDDSFDVTYDWLVDNNVPFDYLLMRKKGDYRKDAIIKLEIFNTIIRDNFQVDFVLDDRDQVVEMWRDLGIKCLQVQKGNF